MSPDFPHSQETLDLLALLEQTINRFVQPGATITAVEPLSMDEHGGMSGATLSRYRVTFQSSSSESDTITLVTKRAQLRERGVLALLCTQRQAVPFSHTLDLTTDMPMLICQQDLIENHHDPLPSDSVRREVQCLACIHSTNLGRAEALSWLPRTDRAYFEEFIIADFRRQLAKAMERPEFVAEYADVIPQMENAVAPFLAAMEKLWEEGPLTLIHGDMHNGNIRVRHGRPYFLDWEHACYGSLFLDLPNHFMLDDALRYRDSLAELGYDIPKERFIERYQQAGRYVGFKYMGFLLHSWMNGWVPSLRGSLLNQLLHGGVAASPA